MKTMRTIFILLALSLSLPAAAQVIAPNYVVVKTVSDLKSRRGFDGQRASTLGYSAVGDGGHATYIWRDTVSRASNDIDFIKPTGWSSNGGWQIDVQDNLIHVKQMGLKGDNTAEGPAIRAAFSTVTANGYGIRGEKSTLNMNGDSVKTTVPLVLHSSTPDFIIRNGKYIVPRAGITAWGVSFQDFTSGAITTDTLNGGINKVIGKLWTVNVQNCLFMNNQYDMREATGAGKRDSTAATGTVLYRSVISNNRFINSKFASLYLDMLYNSVIISNNHFEGTGNAAVWNNGVVIGMDGRANSYKETGLVIEGNTFRNIVHSQDPNGTFYTILARGRGMVFNSNTFQNAGGPVYLGGDFTANNNYLAADTQWVKHGFIAKDIMPDGVVKMSNNTVVGYFGSGFYFDTDVRDVTLTGNTVRLLQKDAFVGQACVRFIGGDGNVKTLNILNNTLNNYQTDGTTNAVFISSTGSIENIVLRGNSIYSTTVGVSAKLINQCTNFTFSDNPFYQAVDLSTIGAQNLYMRNNNFVHLANWINLYIRDQALISGNLIRPDTSLVGSSPATLSRMFNIETDALTNNCQYTLMHNVVDQRKLNNMVRIEDSIASIHVIGDRVVNGVVSASAAYVSSVSNAPLTLNVLFENFYNPFNTTSFSSSTDNQTLNLTFRNCEFARDGFYSLTGLTQVYSSLTIDNCKFPTNPTITQVWASPKYISKAGQNKRSVSSGAYTLVLNDLIEGKSNILEATLGSPITITLPPASSVNLPIGTPLMVYQTGAGAVTVAPGAGVTVTSPNGLVTAGTGQIIRVEKTAAPDTWRAVLLGGASGSGADNWGTDVVNHDVTLTGNGTAASVLKVDTSRIATKSDIAGLDTIYFSNDTYKGFTGDGSAGSPILTKANLQTAETSSSDNQLPLFSGTSGRVFKKSTLSGFLKGTSGVVTSQATINLTTDISGVLPIANGGTNGSTRNSALNNLLPGQASSTASLQLTSNGTDAAWGESGGFTILTGTSTSTTATTLAILPVTGGTAGMVEFYVIARHVIDLNNVELNTFRYTVSYYKNANGTLSHSANTTSAQHSYFTGSYTPSLLFTTDIGTGGLKLTIASEATETTEWTVYYKFWPNVLVQ